MHVWPLLNMPPQTAAFAARSRSASASTIIASLPPSSRLYGISRSAARCAILLPVRVDPVNWMKSASSTSAEPVAPAPVRHSSTPGAPTSSRQPRTISRVATGVSSDGLMATAAPANSAGTASARASRTGLFQGHTTPTTGYGR